MFVTLGSSIKCFACNSKNNSNCADPFGNGPFGHPIECGSIVGEVSFCYKILFKGT